MSRIAFALPLALTALLVIGARESLGAEKHLVLGGAGPGAVLPVHHPSPHGGPGLDHRHTPPWHHHPYPGYPGGPVIVRPPVPGHPTIIYPFPGHPPVVVPSCRPYPYVYPYGYRGRVDYYGRGFGFSFGW